MAHQTTVREPQLSFKILTLSANNKIQMTKGGKNKHNYIQPCLLQILQIQVITLFAEFIYTSCVSLINKVLMLNRFSDTEVKG